MSASRKTTATHCSSCGLPWAQHPGIAMTCEESLNYRDALRIIHTWATCEVGGEYPGFTREGIAGLTAKYLGVASGR